MGYPEIESRVFEVIINRVKNKVNFSLLLYHYTNIPKYYLNFREMNLEKKHFRLYL